MSLGQKLGIRVLASLAVGFLLIGCGGGGTQSGSSANPSGPAPSAAQPGAAAQQTTVVLVVEENQAYEDVIGSSAMPYFNALAQQGALATQYYANIHPSISDYFQLTTGAFQTTDNNFPGPVSADNLARELIAAGKSWKVYAEDLPSPGYLGGDTATYIKHHNPFAYFSDVVNTPAQAANIVPFSQFASDLAAGALPAFAMVIPNTYDDAHTCASGAGCTTATLVSQVDGWLKANIAPLFSNPQFERNGLLLITFDESNIADIRNGGGRVALVAAGPRARAGAQSATIYRHENTLRTICNVLGLGTCPGAAASASAENDLIH
jgi:acid phosphatase